MGWERGLGEVDGLAGGVVWEGERGVGIGKDGVGYYYFRS